MRLEMDTLTIGADENAVPFKTNDPSIIAAHHFKQLHDASFSADPQHRHLVAQGPRYIAARPFAS